MKTKIILILIVALVFLLGVPSVFAQEMTKEQWQQDMSQYTAKRDALKAQAAKLDADIKALQEQSNKLDADLNACHDEFLKLLGVTQAEYDAFLAELSGYENRTNELMRMSDEEVLKYKDEIEKMSARVDEMAKSKIAFLPSIGDRIKKLQDNLAGLMKSLHKEKNYTVGTWSKDRDCLWNIAKKKDIYNNAWLWPKIWQGNTDKIKNPDVIKPKWVLKIPEGTELNKQEKSAANKYYRSKAAVPAAPKEEAAPKK
jgi:nucleoid-associated protein YgaU